MTEPQVWQIQWRDRQITLSFTPHRFMQNSLHLELRCDFALPITETRYKSHFFLREIVPTKAQIEAEVLAWLDEAATQRRWLERLEEERQPGLFD